MPDSNYFEQQFFKALEDIFVGANIEGDSGFINLMHIKSRYYTNGVFPLLKKDIDTALEAFPGFREELFDKLYTFFQRYFSESGSIYFRYTPLHQNIYEKVYTGDRDVVLFWKTHMLYYVKTDRIFKSLTVEVDDVKFYFDASVIEHKKANEKRQVVFTFKEALPDHTLAFTVSYSERGTKTKEEDILKSLKKDGYAVSDETLNKAFRVFEKQSEVDFFINKDARTFLQEQYELWMYQYLFEGKNIWTAERLAQLQALKEIAFKVIDFISQFEDELVKIWNKPKFVRNSHYVITLDHILNPVIANEVKQSPSLLERIFAHPGMAVQIQEWVELGMLEKVTNAESLLELIKETDLTGSPIHPEMRFLTLDTKHFSDLELDILALFDDLDTQLDGWVVHSENYQAINTLRKKYLDCIQCIHIDPPYNTDTSGFLYTNNFQDSSWLCMMENRLHKAKECLNQKGSFLIHVDENEFDYLSSLLRIESFEFQGTVVWDKKHPMMGSKGIAIQHEYIMWISHHLDTFNTSKKNSLSIIEKANELIEKFGGVNDSSRKEFIDWIRSNNDLSGGEKAYQYINDDGRVFQSVGLGWPNPNLAPDQFFIPIIHPVSNKPCSVPSRGWSRSPQKMQELINKNEIIFGEDENIQPRRKLFLQQSTNRSFSSIITDGHKGRTELNQLGLEFSYSHPTTLYENLTLASLLGEDVGVILDYFAGSGTTAHAVMNLNREDGGSRKYILVEMGEHFNTVILPRIKKVAFNSKWKDGKPVFAKGESGMSHFVKYYDLEQYEEVLQQAHYEDADLFNDPNQDPYHAYVFLRDLKMLDSLEIDQQTNKVHFHPERLYTDIDLAETLSHLRGKWIKRITKEFVEFQDGEQLSLTDPDWQTLKPMIWWQ